MIVYPYKRIPSEIRETLPPEWGLGLSDNGWMTREVFYEYIEKVFYPYLVAAKIKFPVVLFIDGHATHLTLKLSQLCDKLQIF